MTTVLSISNLSKVYAAKNGDFQALKDINLDIRRGEIFALLAREAGKSLPDCVAELREAVDFLRYYAAQATGAPAAGIFTCISPWNFPLAIFCGQIGAALAAGNAVLAKPAEQTPLIAHLAISLFHKAGVPVASMTVGRMSIEQTG